jgi:hypothetical protein
MRGAGETVQSWDRLGQTVLGVPRTVPLQPVAVAAVVADVAVVAVAAVAEGGKGRHGPETAIILHKYKSRISKKN